VHLSQVRGAQRDDGNGMRVGLAALSGGEHPGPRRQLRGNVHHRLPVGDQTLREMTAHALAAFHRPQPLRPLASRGQQLPVTLPVGAEPADRQHSFLLVENLDRRGPLIADPSR